MTPATRFRAWGALGFILLLALVLRVPGLAHGLRHLPMQFERVLVLSAWQMVEAGDLDPRSYLYPGFFFYLLYPPVALVEAAKLPLRDAYLASRGLVAAFSVASVALTFLFGSRMAGPRVGLLAALILAVSPLEVENAHWVRPDVVLETFALVAFLAFRRVGDDVRGDVRAGLALGAATAVKFTGALLAPVYLGYRILAPGPRLRRVLLAGAVSVLFFVVLSPHTVLSPERFRSGAREQLAYHYQDRKGELGHGELALFYLRAVVLEVGPLGSALALAGSVILLRRDRRSWAPLLAFPVVALAVYSTARVGGARFLLPMGGLFAVLAACGLQELAGRHRLLGVSAGVLTLLLPLATSVTYDRHVLAPTTLDRALDWIEAHLPEGSRVLSTEKHLGVDRSRIRLKWPSTNFWNADAPKAEDRTLARYMDLVVADPRDPTIDGFREVYRASPENPEAGVELGLFVPPPRREIPLGSVGLTASENEPLLGALREGSGFWHSTDSVGPGSWIQIDFPSPVRLGRLEITLKNHVGPPLALRVKEDGREWKEPAAVEVDESEDIPPTQALLIEPLCVVGARIVPKTSGSTRWTVGGLRLEEVPGAACAPAGPGGKGR